MSEEKQIENVFIGDAEEEDPDVIFIGDLDKLDLLEALWYHSTPARWFALNGVEPPEFITEEAIKHAEQFEWQFAYHQGRCIDSDLSGSKSRRNSYDRVCSQGAFEAVGDAVRKRMEEEEEGY
ncbi:hypothetical protein BJX99DRAFT_255293 [Aspergillus californicus]